uniref:Uncharacterized protein n=3 Tax=Stomoxys calcitrans TaxID=35570 RepID=A0A1I8NP39_STOCA
MDMMTHQIFLEFVRANLLIMSDIQRSKSTSVRDSTSATVTFSKLKMKLANHFPFIGETLLELRKYLADIGNEKVLTDIINKYRRGCYEVYKDVLDSSEMSRMLADNIIRVLDILKDMSIKFFELDEFQHRVCELIAIYISCKLSVSVDCDMEDENLIGNSIVYIMRRHLYLRQNDEDANLYNVLRTLVYIPRFFSARRIVCAIFEEFIPLKAPAEVQQLPDKLYMLYIIVFYRWMKIQQDAGDAEAVLNFAESFMKPRVSLCTNQLYCQHLPRYSRHSMATRTILKNMHFYNDLRNACIIDNAYKLSGAILNLCDDEEDDDVDNRNVIIEDGSVKVMTFAQLFSAVELEIEKPAISHVKHEERTIVDSVDLTVENDDGEDCYTASRTWRERYDNCFEKLALVVRQYNSLQRLKENSKDVICLDISSSEEENQITTTESEHLFDDNSPISNAPIESFSINALDSLKSPSNPSPKKGLRTYKAKKSITCSISSADENCGYSTPSKLFGTRMYSPKPRFCNKLPRRHSLHIHPEPLNQESAEEVCSDEDSYKNLFYCSSSQRLSPLRANGPGVPYANINSTLGGEKVIFSQTSQHSQIRVCDEQNPSQKFEQKSKHFDSSPMDPTTAYSNQQTTNPPFMAHSRNGESSDYWPGSTSCVSCSPSVISNKGYQTNTTNVVFPIEKTSLRRQFKEQKEHIATAATLFQNVFDESRNNRLLSVCSSSCSSYPSIYPTNPRFSHKNQSHLSACLDIQTPMTNSPVVLKPSPLNKRRYTISGHSDFNSYMTNCSTFERNSIGQQSNKIGGSSYEDSNWHENGFHADVDDGAYPYHDEKLSKRCAVIIRPTKELLQYERQRDAMYNEILQKQRRKLELRALEKMREKERRRQDKLQKREQFQLEQSETMKQLERMNLYSQSDDESERNAIPNHGAEECLHSNNGNRGEIGNLCQNHPTFKTTLASHESPIGTNLHPSKESHIDSSSRAHKRCRENFLQSSDGESQPTKRFSMPRNKPKFYCELENHSDFLRSEEDLPSNKKAGKNTKADLEENPQKESPTKPCRNVKINKVTKLNSPQKTSLHAKQFDVEDKDSSELDLLPLKHRKTKQQRRKSQLPKPNVNAIPQKRPVRQCRQNEKRQEEDASHKPSNTQSLTRNMRQRKRSTTSALMVEGDQTTDSEFEYQRPARPARERRKSVLPHLVQTTDSEAEHLPVLALRQSPRFAKDQGYASISAQSSLRQTDSETELTTQLQANKMSPPAAPYRRKNVNRPNKKCLKDNGIEKQMEIVGNATGNVDSALSVTYASDKELSKEIMVDVIAKRLSSPDTSTMANLSKEIETAEREEILETLEDLLENENATKNYNNETVSNEATSPMVVNEALSLNNSPEETANDVVDMHRVIEKIVLNEIQREMDAEDADTEVGIPQANLAEKENVGSLGTQMSLPAERTIINFEEDGLHDILENSTTHTNGLMANHRIPLLITSVQTLPPIQIGENPSQASFLGKGCEESSLTTKLTDTEHQIVEAPSALEKENVEAQVPLNVSTNFLQVDMASTCFNSANQKVRDKPMPLEQTSLETNNEENLIRREIGSVKTTREGHKDMETSEKVKNQGSRELSSIKNVMNTSINSLEETFQANQIDGNKNPTYSLRNSMRGGSVESVTSVQRDISHCLKQTKEDVIMQKKYAPAWSPTEMLELNDYKAGLQNVGKSILRRVYCAEDEQRIATWSPTEMVDDMEPMEIERDMNDQQHIANPKMKSGKTVTFNSKVEIIDIPALSQNNTYSNSNGLEDGGCTSPTSCYYNEQDGENLKNALPMIVSYGYIKQLNTNTQESKHNSVANEAEHGFKAEPQSSADIKKQIAIEPWLTSISHTTQPSTSAHITKGESLTNSRSLYNQNLITAPAAGEYLSCGSAQLQSFDMLNGNFVNCLAIDSTINASTSYGTNDLKEDILKQEKFNALRTINKSMMSPSEQEVSSTQEVFFQTTPQELAAPKGNTWPVALIQLPENAPSNVLQNNQVDTTHQSSEHIVVQHPAADMAVEHLISTSNNNKQEKLKEESEKKRKRVKKETEKETKSSHKSNARSLQPKERKKKGFSERKHSSHTTQTTHLMTKTEGASKPSESTFIVCPTALEEKSKTRKFKIPKIKATNAEVSSLPEQNLAYKLIDSENKAQSNKFKVSIDLIKQKKPSKGGATKTKIALTIENKEDITPKKEIKEGHVNKSRETKPCITILEKESEGKKQKSKIAKNKSALREPGKDRDPLEIEITKKKHKTNEKAKCKVKPKIINIEPELNAKKVTSESIDDMTKIFLENGKANDVKAVCTHSAPNFTSSKHVPSILPKRGDSPKSDTIFLKQIVTIGQSMDQNMIPTKYMEGLRGEDPLNTQQAETKEKPKVQKHNLEFEKSKKPKPTSTPQKSDHPCIDYKVNAKTHQFRANKKTSMDKEAKLANSNSTQELKTRNQQSIIDSKQSKLLEPHKTNDPLGKAKKTDKESDFKLDKAKNANSKSNPKGSHSSVQKSSDPLNNENDLTLDKARNPNPKPNLEGNHLYLPQSAEPPNKLNSEDDSKPNLEGTHLDSANYLNELLQAKTKKCDGVDAAATTSNEISDSKVNLPEVIAKEIYIMAAEVTIPLSPNKLKLSESSTDASKSSESSVGLKEPATTGIKSAVNHGHRKYSRSKSKRNSDKDENYNVTSTGSITKTKSNYNSMKEKSTSNETTKNYLSKCAYELSAKEQRKHENLISPQQTSSQNTQENNEISTSLTDDLSKAKIASSKGNPEDDISSSPVRKKSRIK